MEKEILQVAVQEGLLSWLSTVGIFLAVLTAILLPFIRDRIRETKNANAIKNEACLYLNILKSKLDQIIRDGGVRITGEFEEDNKKNFNALEVICRLATSLKPKERTEFIKFVTYFKTSEPIDTRDLELVVLKQYLYEINTLITLFRKSMKDTS